MLLCVAAHLPAGVGDSKRWDSQCLTPALLESVSSWKNLSMDKASCLLRPRCNSCSLQSDCNAVSLLIAEKMQWEWG